MPTLPHFPWPYELGQTIEQNTFDATQAAAAVALCTPRGHRPDVPEYGVTMPLLEPAPVDTAMLAAELATSGVTDVEITDVTELATATIARLHVDLTANG